MAVQKFAQLFVFCAWVFTVDSDAWNLPSRLIVFSIGTYQMMSLNSVVSMPNQTSVTLQNSGMNYASRVGRVEKHWRRIR